MSRIKSVEEDGNKNVTIKFDENAFRNIVGSSIRALNRDIQYFQRYKGEEILMSELYMHIQILELTAIISVIEFDIETKVLMRKLLFKVDQLICTMDGMSETEKAVIRPNKEVMKKMKNW